MQVQSNVQVQVQYLQDKQLESNQGEGSPSSFLGTPFTLTGQDLVWMKMISGHMDVSNGTNPLNKRSSNYSHQIKNVFSRQNLGHLCY